MKADEPLEWEPTDAWGDERYFALSEFHRFMDSYVVFPWNDKRWKLEGAGRSSGRYKTAAAAKRAAQDHYNRKRRLKAWEDYMLTHEPPNGGVDD